ncbi:MAG TPA: glycosyltransferase family 39 protein [Epsilonproteobacteria bacterium]|nr:glycosyltransferase family 39 protein [Campylobacterota bacterium]
MNQVRYPELILFFFILLAFYFPLPLAPLFDLDEGAFSEATREMIATRDYITTHLNGGLRFDKPILIYWLQMFSVKLFGLNEFALRLPSALAATAWAYIIYYFTQNFYSRNTAFFAALFMVASLQVNLIAKAAIADALLNLFIVLSMFYMYRYYLTQSSKYLYYTFLFIGLGTLTKGPVAIMIPLVVSFLFYAFKKDLKAWMKAVFNPVGILIFVLVALPWYIAEYMAQGEAFIDGFFLKHNLSRFSNAMESHSGSIFYFIPVLIVGMMPFTYLVIKALKKAKLYFKEEFRLFLFIWFIFVFAFFSLSGTKLPHYVIYGYTPLFILAAVIVENEHIKKGWLLIPLLILLGILLFLPDIALMLKASIQDKLAVVLIEQSLDTFDFTYRASIVTMIILTLAIYAIKFQKHYVLMGVAVVMIVTVNYIVIPTYGKLMQQPIKEAAHLAKQKDLKNIIMYKINTPSFNVYYEDLVRKIKPKIGDIVFTKVTKLKDFKTYEILYRKNGFVLLKVESL